MSHRVVRSLTAMLLLPALALSVPASADDRTPSAGGGGGGPYETGCGATWALRGFDMRVGSWVDALRTICIGSSTPKEDGAVDEKKVEPFHGGTGGGPKQIFCYKNTAVRGLVVRHGMLTDHTRGVTGIRLVCGHVDGTGGPIPQAYGEYFGETKPKSSDAALNCPSGEIAVGIYGRSGKWLDQIGLICGPPRVR